MNPALHRICFALWMVGFAGMWLTKGLKPVGELPFEISATLSLVGMLSMMLLLAIDLCVRARCGD